MSIPRPRLADLDQLRDQLHACVHAVRYIGIYGSGSGRIATAPAPPPGYSLIVFTFDDGIMCIPVLDCTGIETSCKHRL